MSNKVKIKKKPAAQKVDDKLYHPELDEAAHLLDNFRNELNKATKEGEDIDISITAEKSHDLQKAILLAITGLVYMDTYSAKAEAQANTIGDPEGDDCK